MGTTSIRVTSTKYDGSLRDFYDAELLYVDESAVRIKVPSGTPIWVEKHGKTELSEDNAIEIYFTDRWYNVWHFREHTTNPNSWYSNVAMPARFDGTTLQWVDLDIDIRCYADGSLRVFDQDEFEQNRVEMGYPTEVVKRAVAARNEVLQLGKVGIFPFNYETQIRYGAFG